MLATSGDAVYAFDRLHYQRTRTIGTHAFTDKPVSMKYRGIFEVRTRQPGKLYLVAPVRPGSPGEVYLDWYRRHASAG